MAKRDMNGWRSLKNDPPGPEHKTFFVGHSRGGRIDYVFMWPYGNKMRFWCKGEHGNYVLRGYTPNVWHPGPPPIPGSDIAERRPLAKTELSITMEKANG